MLRLLVSVLRRMCRRPLSTLLSLTMLCAVLLIGGLAGTLVFNVQHLLGELQREVGLVVYVEDSAPAGRLEDLARELGGFPGVQRVRPVPRNLALADLRSSLGPDADLLDELGPALLPDSLEIVPGPAAATEEGLNALSKRVTGLKGVAAVSRAGQGRDSVIQMGALLSLLRVGGAAVFGIMLALVCWIAAGVIGLAFLARAEEVRLLRLLGASEIFIARPFFVEGLLLSLGGAGLAVIGLLGGIGALRSVLGPEAVMVGIPIELPPLWAGTVFIALAGLAGLVGAYWGTARTVRQ